VCPSRDSVSRRYHMSIRRRCVQYLRNVRTADSRHECVVYDTVSTCICCYLWVDRKQVKVKKCGGGPTMRASINPTPAAPRDPLQVHHHIIIIFISFLFDRTAFFASTSANTRVPNLASSRVGERERERESSNNTLSHSSFPARLNSVTTTR
jgi:hypothetical protein